MHLAKRTMGGCYPHPYGDEDFSSFDSSEDLFDSEDFEMKPYKDEEDSKDYYATGKCKELHWIDWLENDASVMDEGS